MHMAYTVSFIFLYIYSRDTTKVFSGYTNLTGWESVISPGLCVWTMEVCPIRDLSMTRLLPGVRLEASEKIAWNQITISQK